MYEKNLLSSYQPNVDGVVSIVKNKCKPYSTSVNKSVKSFFAKVTLLLQSAQHTPNWFSISAFFPTPTRFLSSIHTSSSPSKQRDITSPLCARGDLTGTMMSFSKVIHRSTLRGLSLQRVGLSQPSSVWRSTAILAFRDRNRLRRSHSNTLLGFPWIVFRWPVRLVTLFVQVASLCVANKESQTADSYVHKRSSTTRCQHCYGLEYIYVHFNSNVTQ